MEDFRKALAYIVAFCFGAFMIGLRHNITTVRLFWGTSFIVTAIVYVCLTVKKAFQ
jgi:hypothetical protein